jgi:hypothetical protein
MHMPYTVDVKSSGLDVRSNAGVLVLLCAMLCTFWAFCGCPSCVRRDLGSQKATGDMDKIKTHTNPSQSAGAGYKDNAVEELAAALTLAFTDPRCD